jgi:hypothetical protein
MKYITGEHQNLAEKIQKGLDSFNIQAPVELNPLEKAKALLAHKISQLRNKGFAPDSKSTTKIEYSHRVMAPIIWAVMLATGPLIGVVGNAAMSGGINLLNAEHDERPKQFVSGEKSSEEEKIASKNADSKGKAVDKTH